MLRDISLHIHDLSENSITAGATLIRISLSAADGILTLVIADNGKGMSPELLAKVEDPFTTSRTERKVGMGIPFFKLACEQTGGSFRIKSEPGKGTELTGRLVIDNIDRIPLGDAGETVSMLILESPETRFVLELTARGESFTLDTDEVREQLDGAPINDFEILQWIKEYVNEGVLNIFGGVLDEIT
ncbi:MAG: sensor histidine kinase [Clostridia bacterium]|nr:sensor histidine kinase [Clostridia bacterium]